jgi:hypothetical protein
VPAAVAVTGTKNATSTLTASLTGYAATTTYNVMISQPGSGVKTIPVTTDGAGAASTTFFVHTAGVVSIDTQIVPSSIATTTAVIGNPNSG